MALTLNNNLNSTKVGDYFWCHYKVDLESNVGVFSDIATKTDAEVAGQTIPVESSNLPNGYFRFIMVENWNGNRRLIADRNIQHSISWDTLNTAGIASGSGVLVPFKGVNHTLAFSIRLLTGGISTAHKYTEWDRHIVSSTIGGKITAGDNAVWNWNIPDRRTWTTSMITASATARVVRGHSTTGTSPLGIGAFSNAQSGDFGCFRPVLEIERQTIDKSFILFGGQYKKYKNGTPPISGNSDAVPVMTSNNRPYGIASASGEYSATYQAWKAFNSYKGASTNGWESDTATGWLQYDFGHQVEISSYRLTGLIYYGTTNMLPRNPRNWTFEGSNDGVSWVVLDTENDVTDWVRNQYKTYSLSSPANYSVYRINVTLNNGHETILAIGGLELITAVDTPATPPSWTTVSPTLPTLPQFQSEGMDSLSVFDRQVQSVFDSPKTMMPSEALGAGKIFKTTLNLKKHFDLRVLDIK